MKAVEKKKAFFVTSVTIAPLLVAGTLFFSSTHPITITKASDDKTMVLNSSNSPILSEGEGTMVDSHGVTWEYHEASNNVSGHVTLNHEGYCGVSQYSAYGYTGISNIEVTFEAGSAG